jgi:DnaJ-class molecular chaperone
MQHWCDKCNAQGYIALEKCTHCNSKKTVRGSVKMNVQVEKGMKEGATIKFEGQASQGPDFFPGDVVFKVKINKHATFTRKGNDLHTTVDLTLKESLLGYTKQITHLDGHIV